MVSGCSLRFKYLSCLMFVEIINHNLSIRDIFKQYFTLYFIIETIEDKKIIMDGGNEYLIYMQLLTEIKSIIYSITQYLKVPRIVFENRINWALVCLHKVYNYVMLIYRRHILVSMTFLNNKIYKLRLQPREQLKYIHNQACGDIAKYLHRLVNVVYQRVTVCRQFLYIKLMQ